MTRLRVLVWDGCVNVRDLGGLPLEGGGETNFGVLVRADSIGTLTEAGWAALQDYGVTTAVDLRGEHELEEPANAQQQPIRIVSIPIAPRSGPGWNWPSMLDAYLGVLEEFRPQFVAAVVAVAAAEPPVVIHCQGGRDRTGLVVALVLRCAGVDPEAIALDHAISDDSWAPYNPTWFDEAANAQSSRVPPVPVTWTKPWPGEPITVVGVINSELGNAVPLFVMTRLPVAEISRLPVATLARLIR